MKKASLYILLLLEILFVVVVSTAIITMKMEIDSLKEKVEELEKRVYPVRFY